MFVTQTTFIGIDPTAGNKPFVYAALDHELGLHALGEGNIDDVLAFTAGQRLALVSICAPRKPNQGIMSNRDRRNQLQPAPSPGRWINFRLADYLIRQHNINIPQTPNKEKDCPNWMKMGFNLYHRLETFGYKPFPDHNSELQFLEVYPHASYAILLGRLPFPKHSLEGRLQRQLVLYEQGLQIPDPMRIFEEITRHRLLHGILPLDELYTAGELDALVGAYTAFLAASHPEEITLLGDPDEGQIVLPSATVKPRY